MNDIEYPALELFSVYSLKCSYVETDLYSAGLARIFSFSLMIFDGLSQRIIPSGQYSLFRPSNRRLGVMRSRHSISPETSPMANGRLLIWFAMLEASVSHRRSDKRCCWRLFSMEELISLILRSTFPCILCPCTGHTSKSTRPFFINLDLRLVQFNSISLQPFTSWLPSTTSVSTT